MKLPSPVIARLSLALVIPGLTFAPTSYGSLSLYDTEIASDHGGGAGSLPYAATLTTAAVFDGMNATPFDFGALAGPATIEVIIEGDPVAGGQNGYIGEGANGGNSLRFEQWNDTGTMGFTRSGVADYDLAVASPTEPTHVAYRWDGAGTMDLFVDGALAGTVTGATFEMPAGAGLLGNVSDGGGQGMIGTILRITTYDSALEDAAIQSHANAWLATGDPNIALPITFELTLDGSVQSFSLPVSNFGESNTLSISMVDRTGTDAAKITIDTPLPLDIAPGADSAIDFTFDPMGANGAVEATLTIFSNDLLNEEAEVQVSGVIRDPQIDVPAVHNFGSSADPLTEMVQVQNLGATRPLNLTMYEVTGPDADKFSATGPASIPVGGSGDISVTYTPAGATGAFNAQLEITSDDPGEPIALVALRAVGPLSEGFVSVYDSVIASDHGEGVGPIPYDAVLSDSLYLDTNNSGPFDFGAITGDATFEFIVEGNPVDGGQNGYLAVGENATQSLRYEQWDDTGALGFTTAGVEDYLFQPEGDAALLDSPENPTHVAYLWQSAATTMNLYIDGMLAGTHVGSGFEMPIGQGTLGNNAGGNEGMLGAIHRVTIYNNDIGAENVLRHALAFTEGVGGGDGFKIVAVSHDTGAGMVTFTWSSIPGAFYAVERSYDLVAWEELDDNVASQGTTTEYSVPATLPAGETGVYVRALRL